MKNPKVTIIGGGIVGLATAYRLQEYLPDAHITLLEKESRLAVHQTGHNSGVLHAGLYYAPGSLKARLCTEGLTRMVEFCEQNNISFEQCGKIVVAIGPEEIPRLQALYQRSIQNGLQGVRQISPEELREREPHAAGIAAVFVPQSGIVDYKAVCETLAKLIKAHGGEIKLSQPVTGLKFEKTEWVIETPKETLKSDFIINCTGLHSDRLLKKSGIKRDVRIVPFRGEYYKLKPHRQHLVKHLIYPVPDPQFPFLGVHFTRMISGGIECGPNAVLALKREGYKKTDVSLKDLWDVISFGGFWRFTRRHWQPGIEEFRRSLSKKLFCQSLQKLVPEVQESDLEEGGSGVRAQAMDAQGNLVQDFHIISHERALHVLNTPSPAATSSLAIGGEIAQRFSSMFSENNPA